MKTTLCNTLILFFIHLCSTNSFAQSDAQPLRSLHGPDKSPVELIGHDPGFVVWCLQSEFGKYQNQQNASGSETSETGEESEPISLTWKNVVRKEWSVQPFDIHFKASINSYQLDDGNNGRASQMSLSFIDKRGNDLLRAKTPSGVAIRKFLQTLLFQSTSYVNSANGLNVRAQPSLTAPVIEKLADNSRVIVKERTGQWFDLVKDGDTIKTEWVKVYINEGVNGYAANAFLSPFNALRSSEINMLNDSLQGYMELALIDYEKYRAKKAANIYSLDTTNIVIPALPPASEEGAFDAFCLPIKNGKDSLVFFSNHGEYGDISRSYLGKVNVLNSYLIQTSGFFFDGHALYDIATGDNIWHSDGMPRLSPDGKFIIDLYDYDEPEVTEDLPHCNITLGGKTGDKFTNKSFHLPYPFFFSSSEDDAFWISDDELIIRLYKLVPYHADFTDHRNTLPNQLQYVRLKIIKSPTEVE